MMINEQQFVLFFTAKQDQCMQVLLVRTTARPAESGSHSWSNRNNQKIG